MRRTMFNLRKSGRTVESSTLCSSQTLTKDNEHSLV